MERTVENLVIIENGGENPLYAIPGLADDLDEISEETSEEVLETAEKEAEAQPKPVKRPSNKKKGVKSEVYPLELSDIKKLNDYFYQKGKWVQYLAFVLSINLARRVGDMLSLRWINFFDPETGEMRQDLLEIQEQKTEKLSNPHINNAVRDAINLFIEKTRVDVSANNYQNYVFTQISGPRRGEVLTYDGWRRALKRTAKKLGITYNVGTHSLRKTFGKTSRMLHPNDYDSMELLQTIYNHDDTQTTAKYIGLTKQKVDNYYDDMGDFYDRYITKGMEYESVAPRPVITVDLNDLRDVIRTAYLAGQNAAGETDPGVHISNIGDLWELAEDLAKK